MKIRVLLVFIFLTIFLGISSATADPKPMPKCDGEDRSDSTIQYCSSATNPITASYATMGYWTLGALLQKFGGIEQTSSEPAPYGQEDSYFRLMGAFVFIFSIIAAIVMMAMGQPPKMYGWFAAGPALFYFLIFNIVQRDGVAWEIGGVRQDQQVVWELAYTGLNSNSLIKDTATDAIPANYRTEGASYGVHVPWLFAKVDDVSTEVIQNIVGLMGIRGDLSADRNGDAAAPSDDLKKNWPLLSTEKWELMENITSAKIFNNDLRELLVQYMASECGDKMGEFLHKGAFSSASNTSGVKLPKTLFCSNPNTDCLAKDATISTDCTSGSNDKVKLLCELNKIRLPTPYVFKQLLSTKQPSADFSTPKYFQFAFGDSGTTLATAVDNYKAQTVTCDDWLWMIMTGIRWESSIHYAQLRNTLKLPVESAAVKTNVISNELVDFMFTYDWELLDEEGVDHPFTDIGDREEFMLHMIMAYMIRNEFALAPQLAEQRFLPTENSSRFAEEFSRNINSKNKFAEIYTWAKMLPHVQGMMLYLLSIGYPLACIMVLVPGKWSWMFTWASFYIWTKSWDAGFAVVQNIEKSIWANLGNSNETASLNYRIFNLDEADAVKIDFDSTGAASFVLQDKIMDEGAALDLFDRGLILSRALNHDLVNSYYIYLMSALYFAVPAVTGQILLGAKSGMSGMVKEAIGGVSAEGGSAARSGAVGEETRHGMMNQQAAEQSFAAKGGRQQGMALRALQSKNAAMGLEMRSGALGTRSSLMDMGGQSVSDGMQKGEAGVGVEMAKWGSDMANFRGNSAVVAATSTKDKLEQVRAQNQSKSNPASQSNPAAVNASGAGAVDASGAAAQGAPSGAETMAPVNPRNLQSMLLSDGGMSAYRAAHAALDAQGGRMDAQAGIKKAQWSEGMQTGVLDARQATRSANVQSTMGQFAMGQQARATSEASGRQQQQANYGMREQSYSEGARFSRHMAGMMAARGVVAGSFDPKDKPKDMESIGAGGHFGSSYNQAFGYPSNGFMSELGGQVKALSPAVAYASTNYNAHAGSGINLDPQRGGLNSAQTAQFALLGGEGVALKDPGKMGIAALGLATQYGGVEGGLVAQSPGAIAGSIANQATSLGTDALSKVGDNISKQWEGQMETYDQARADKKGL